MRNKNKLIARYIAHYAVRNSILENFHAGTFPSSKRKDSSDVKVVTPYGEIPWKDVSRISDVEMRKLMLDIEKNIARVLTKLPEMLEAAGSLEKYYELLEQWGFGEGAGVSWDVPAAQHKKWLSIGKQIKKEKSKK
ncbi:MAG: hypothetical protein ABIQ40_03285 [Bacteroidia bacterium]